MQMFVRNGYIIYSQAMTLSFLQRHPLPSVLLSFPNQCLFHPKRASYRIASRGDLHARNAGSASHKCSLEKTMQQMNVEIQGNDFTIKKVDVGSNQRIFFQNAKLLFLRKYSQQKIEKIDIILTLKFTYVYSDYNNFYKLSTSTEISFLNFKKF